MVVAESFNSFSDITGIILPRGGNYKVHYLVKTVLLPDDQYPLSWQIQASAVVNGSAIGPVSVNVN